MKLPESIIGEIVVFTVLVALIGGVCAVAMLPIAAYGLYKKIFDVKDQP
jgi:hypothetical protein